MQPINASVSSKLDPRDVLVVYRTILRYAGASVLYSRPAVWHIRQQYRPVFDVWMKRAKYSDSVNEDAWSMFRSRLQSTLDFMHDATLHTGLTHRVTKHLALLQFHRNPPKNSPTRRGLNQHDSAFAAHPKSPLNSQTRSAWDGVDDVLAQAASSNGIVFGTIDRRPFWDTEHKTHVRLGYRKSRRSPWLAH